MVVAGVYLVARLYGVFWEGFSIAAGGINPMALIGAITVIACAALAFVQDDVKKVLAYSTVSQLGYMVMALGVGAWTAGIFHLFTHAAFKALLFLGAGSVIHAMHHEQDMRFYGGLRKEIPFTFWAMLAGTLAITGVGIIQIRGFAGFGFAGFYSKDAIIESAFASGTTAGGIAFAVGVFAALLTSFYSWRLMFLTFWGKPRWAASEHIQHALHGDRHDHTDAEDAGHDTRPGEAGAQEIPAGTGGYRPHESPWTILVPLGLLSLGAILAGIVFHAPFIGAEEGPRFWAGSIAFDGHLAHAIHLVPLWVKLAPGTVMLIGFLIALQAYVRSTSIPERFVGQWAVLYRFLYNKWYFDELYDLLFVRPALWVGRILWKKGDEGMIDRFGPDGAAALIVNGTSLTARLQSGYLYTYALVMLLGLAAFATWAMAS
jgi:NADH-quinone oxidoreductase subunit L